MLSSGCCRRFTLAIRGSLTGTVTHSGTWMAMADAAVTAVLARLVQRETFHPQVEFLTSRAVRCCCRFVIFFFVGKNKFSFFRFVVGYFLGTHTHARILTKVACGANLAELK